MPFLRFTRSTVALAVVALAIAAGTATLAAASGGNTISVCVHHHGGGLYSASHCARHDRRLTWSIQGPQGPQGIQGSPGTPGAAGAPATTLWAVVNAGATPERESGVVGASNPSTGEYTVTFDQDVSGCAYLATIGSDTSSREPAAFVTVASGASPDSVDVNTFNSAAAAAELPFHLGVFC